MDESAVGPMGSAVATAKGMACGIAGKMGTGAEKGLAAQIGK